MAYMDNTGLYRKYGTEKATANKGGEYRKNGLLREIEFVINLADLTETETPLSDQVFFPQGVRIHEVEITTTTAAATGTAIDIGLIKTDRTTEADYDGLLAAFPTASMNAASENNVIRAGDSFAGALLGTTTSTSYGTYVSASRTTATAFTAGKIVVRVRYYKP